MLKNNGQERQETGKMMALTLVLTNFLLLTVAVALVWMVQILLSESSRLNELTRGIILQ